MQYRLCIYVDVCTLNRFFCINKIKKLIQQLRANNSGNGYFTMVPTNLITYALFANIGDFNANCPLMYYIE